MRFLTGRPSTIVEVQTSVGDHLGHRRIAPERRLVRQWLREHPVDIDWVISRIRRVEAS